MTEIIGSIKTNMWYAKTVSSNKSRSRLKEAQILLQIGVGAVAEWQGVAPVEEFQVISFPEDKILNKSRYTSKITVYFQKLGIALNKKDYFGRDAVPAVMGMDEVYGLE